MTSRLSHLPLLLALGALVAGPRLAPGQSPEDLGRLKEQFREFCRGYPQRDNEQLLSLPPDQKVVAGWQAAFQPDGHWSDIAYQDQTRNFWKAAAHLKRVLSLAIMAERGRALHAPLAALEATVIAATHYWISHDFQNPNWWQNEIGVPRDLSAILLLMGERIPPADLAAAGPILARAGLSRTGQNLVWEAGILFRAALLRGDCATAAKARAVILQALTQTTGEGLQPDESFHQHGPQDQMGNYGLAFAAEMSAWAYLWRGTSWAMPPERLSLLRDFLLRGEAVVAVNGALDLSACDRQLFPGSAAGKAAGLAVDLQLMTQADARHAGEYRAAMARDALPNKGPAEPAADAPLCQVFYRSDYLVFRRPDFYASVKMCSRRVIGGEATNQENLRGRYLADGFLFTSANDSRYRDIFPVWDWRKLPGTTTTSSSSGTGTTLLPAGHMDTDFAGAVTDGTFGAAGLDYRRDGVSGKKAWFFFDHQIVCLGAGLSGPAPLTTALEQCLAGPGEIATDRGVSPEEGFHEVPNARWILHGGWGYLFPEPRPAWLGVQRREGTWQSIYASGSPDPVSHDLFALWLDHGPAPRAATYACTILPGATAGTLRAEASHPGVTILSNTPEVQAAENPGAHLVEVIFHTAGQVASSAGLITAEQPCALLYRRDGGRLYVADPTQKLREITVAVDGHRQTVPMPEGEQAGMSAALLLP